MVDLEEITEKIYYLICPEGHFIPISEDMYKNQYNGPVQKLVEYCSHCEKQYYYNNFKQLIH